MGFHDQTDRTPPHYRFGDFDDDLDLLFQAVADLREIAADQGRRTDDGLIYDFSIWWGTLIRGRWERISHYRQRSELTPAERDRFDRLRAELSEAIPLLERLGLAKPTTPSDGW